MDEEELETIISSLPKQKGWLLENIYKYKGFWFEKPLLKGSLIVQKSFNPTPETVLLSTFPKSGSTWFCALLFTTINRTQYHYTTHPLLTHNPHDCAPQIEYKALKNPSKPNLTFSSTPPLIATHIPYSLLPDSVKQQPKCKIVYVCRDPLDNFVSLFHYANKVRPKQLPPLSVDEAFDMFCNGVSSYGSYWDHVVEYWNASLQMPGKVCFLRFEDMIEKPGMVLKKVAEFIGCPFSSEEEENGVIQKIVEFCSFDSLSSLKVNSNTEVRTTVPGVNNRNDAFFRKGQIGDHKNYLTDEMIHRLTDAIKGKFAGDRRSRKWRRQRSGGSGDWFSRAIQSSVNDFGVTAVYGSEEQYRAAWSIVGVVDLWFIRRRRSVGHKRRPMAGSDIDWFAPCEKLMLGLG